MLGHLGLNVPDLGAAKRYYDSLVDLLGFESFLEHEDEFAYRPLNAKPGTFLFFYPSEGNQRYDARDTGLQHLAFIVRSRSAVHAVHERVIELGSVVVHEPRVFPEYPQPYYAMFWHDPFGFLLEAVCHHDRD